MDQSETTPENKKPKSKNKILVLITVLFVGLSSITFFGLGLLDRLLPQDQTTTIAIETGSASKILSNGSPQELRSGQTLLPGDKIKTGPGADAVITFANGSQLRLDENTEVAVNSSTDRIAISQTLGRTWSRVMKLLGQSQSYEIETPTAVATVRGTTFSTTVGNEETLIEGDSEKVEVSAYERIGTERRLFETLILSTDESVRIRRQDLKDLKEGRRQLLKEKLREEIKRSPWFQRNRQRDLSPIKSKRSSPSRLVDLMGELRGLPQDILKLKSLMEKVRSGNLALSPEQKRSLEPFLEKFKTSGTLTPERIPEATQILSIVDPENFGDTVYWEKRLRLIWPIIERFQVQKFSADSNR